MCVGICLHVYVCTAHRCLVSKEAKTGLELELEMVVSLHVEHRSSGSIVSAITAEPSF